MKKYLEKINTSKYLVPALVVICFGMFVAGFFLGEHKEKKVVKKYIASFKNLRDEGDKFQFINPLLGGFSDPATEIGIYTDIKDDVEDFFLKEKKEGRLYDYSFYFKDLGSPLWFGINEEKSFTPASLFKLPIAIIVYRQAETNPSILQRTLTYTQEMKDINQSIPGNDDSVLVVGKSYTVEELTRIMLEFSDNGAKDLLANVIEEKSVSELFAAISLIDPLSSTSYEISSRKYAFFLRILHNGGYLKKASSEYLLSLLSKSAFKDGLVAGVPGNIVVSHKFGVHDTVVTINGKDEAMSVFSDCGIVYYEDSPYALCIMTQGKSISDLLKIVSHVSKMVYEDAKKSE